MLQIIVHYGCHFLIPLAVALLAFRATWKIAFLILLSGLWIDVDHFWATPFFDPNRCSINFHPLHSYVAMAICALFLFPKKTRLFALGFVIHIFADTMDCLFM